MAGFGEELISAYIQQSANMNGDIYANRLDAEGNLVWTDETVTVTNSGTAKSDMMAGKGPNCLFIAWTENGSVYAHCLREDGTLGAPDVGSSDCTADDGTEGVELWDVCYSIENTTMLQLIYIELADTIPSEIGNLINLESLILVGNELYGGIPSEIGNLTNLTSLNLSLNQLTGEIPSEIGNLTNLTHFKLNENELTGEIPSEIGNLTNLEVLSLWSNQLTGSIPPEIGNLTNLTILSLYNNQLTGSIPPEIGNLTNLTILTLYNNQLTGEIPESICDLNIDWISYTIIWEPYFHIIYSGISNNQLCPPYPSCIEGYVGYQNMCSCGFDNDDVVYLWGNCYSIENTTELDLGYNQLTGSIPPEIGNLTNLTYLNLGHNQLTGEIPPEIGNLTNLTSLRLTTNQLTGEIPSEIGNLTNLEFLHLSQNELSGEIPSEIGNLTNLERLFLDTNQLTGSIPPEIGNLTNLGALHLQDNQLSGSIPSEFGNMTNLTHLSLYNNQLTGEIPESICELTNLNWSPEYIDWDYSYIYNNQLCPPYPSCIEDYVGEQDTTNCEQVSIIDETLPITYNLHNAYPNPFNPKTTLHYDLPEDAMVSITIYDMMGRVVNTLINGSQTSGYKTIQWDATNDRNEPVSAGLYLYTIQAGEFRQTKKMVLLK